MATPEKYSHISFKPPSGVRREAEYGLKLRREHGRGGTAVGIARARDLSNGSEVSPSTVRRMKAYFDRHASDQQGEGFDRGDKGWPSNGYIAAKLWGGFQSGYSWAKKVVEQMNAADERSYSLDTETRSIHGKEIAMQNVERRYLAASGSENATEGTLGIEHRADPQTGERRTYLIGYAAKFNTDSLLLGDFVERISPSAFEIVENGEDLEGKPLETRGLFNHDPNHLIGRFPNTMKLVVDKIGLKYEILLPESRKDLAEMVSRGDLKGSSFSFVVAEGGEKWTREGGKSRRLVTKIKALLDCGPVTYPAYRDSSVAVAKRSYEQFSSVADSPKVDFKEEMRKLREFYDERRDCGKNPDGTFAAGNTCAGGSSVSEAKGSLAGKGAVTGFNAGNLIGKPFTGAAVGALVGSMMATKSESLEKAYHRTGTSFDKAKKVADIFGDDMKATHSFDDRGSYALQLSGKKLEILVERKGGKNGVNAQVTLRGGEDPSVHKDAIIKSAKALGVNTVTVAVGRGNENGDKSIASLKEAGFTPSGKNDSNQFFTKQVKKWDSSQKPKTYRGPSKEASLPEKILAGASLVKTGIDIANDAGLLAPSIAKLSKVIKGTSKIPYSVDGGIVKNGRWTPRSLPPEIKSSIEGLIDFYSERRGFCPTGPGGGVDNSCGGSEGTAKAEQKPGDPKYMEWKKGKDHKGEGKTKKAQEFLDKAREEQLSKGGKDKGKSDEGGGVQTWSKGDNFPWTTKQVGDKDGYLQGVHPDGSKTEKYPFKDGDTSEAEKNLGEELKRRPGKRAYDPRQVIEDTLRFLKDRR